MDLEEFLSENGIPPSPSQHDHSPHPPGLQPASSAAPSVMDLSSRASAPIHPGIPSPNCMQSPIRPGKLSEASPFRWGGGGKGGPGWGDLSILTIRGASARSKRGVLYFTHFTEHPHHLESQLNADSMAPRLEILIFQVHGEAQEYAFLTSFLRDSDAANPRTAVSETPACS